MGKVLPGLGGPVAQDGRRGPRRRLACTEPEMKLTCLSTPIPTSVPRVHSLSAPCHYCFALAAVEGQIGSHRIGDSLLGDNWRAAR
jgi:hypothetical protein